MLDKIVNTPQQKLLATEKSLSLEVVYLQFQGPVVIARMDRSFPVTIPQVEQHFKQKVVHCVHVTKNDSQFTEYLKLDWYCQNVS